MSDKTIRPYGSWPSPLSPRELAGQLRLSEVQWAGDGETLVWLEGRSAASVLVAQRGVDAACDVTGPDVSVRGGVGYGGGEFAVWQDVIFFASSDGRLYRVDLEHGGARAITTPFGKVAAPTPSPCGEWIAYVHTDGHHDALAIVDADGEKWPAQLVTGRDFITQPSWHPSGDRLAWVSWDHPDMPWTGARVELASVTVDARGVSLGPVEVIAGAPGTIAAQQPIFSPDGEWLAYVSDEAGWLNVYARSLATGEVRQLTANDAEYGVPPWVQGMRTIGWSPDSSAVLAIRNAAGQQTLQRLGLDGTSAQVPGLEAYEALSQLSVSATGRVAVLASASRIPPRVVSVTNGQARVHKRATSERLRPEALSTMQPVSWRAPDGMEVFGNFYPPTSETSAGQGAPPVIVLIHGGPTAQRTAAFDSRCQFFATRGYAVLDVNYRGSTGYGRAYMQALNGQWGVFDVEDAIGGVKSLGERGLVDPARAVIMGGSAGGYTVLQALTDHPGAFAAGISMYGISDLFALAAGTHKFEAHYNDSLIGPLPEATDLYRARSPLFKADRIADPVAVFQGADDRVVPLDQAEAIVSALQKRKVPHAYHVYEGEGHGWRKAETIEHFYTEVLRFLEQHVLA